ncbi:glycosyl-transferase for dystroglycan-domain-containing protein [Mycotypha africana]|uniref:glycosyl-transferase for dystroglycan-domain-containing protein n=1 Tax=Mycotypha africana TaxID=64632 RepID=UPI002300D0B4|nr:glycosyl-transferase for dystroglycan-domain-containing protein [Mycotypha africana]KAI8975511.1 glycosyl-transferase for dystroglycan-domain-containing protein [Mycotypha africana]
MLKESLAFSKIVQIFIIIYLASSLLYATLHLLGFGWFQNLSIVATTAKDKSALLDNPLTSRSEPITVSQLHKRYHSSQTVIWSNAEGGQTQTIPENLIVGKVFADAMGPSKVIPYYFRASEHFEQEDITIATLVTHNRFPVLSRLASRYKGPISVAIHVNDDSTKGTILKDLHNIYEENPDVRKYVDIHLVVDKFDRQFNMWRNVAKFFTRTDYLMMLDVDFHLCTDFRESLKKHEDLMERLRSGRAAVVVPAFEYIAEEDGEDWRLFPKDKEALMNIVLTEEIDMFHLNWTRGHGSTDYKKWYRSSQPYKVTDYNYSYEPYVIYKKEGTPWCEERFVGYGANKAACLYEIYLAGIDYWVLPDDFLIHQTHHYPEETRAKERKYNKKLYEYFREEVCLRYSRLMISAGLWDTDIADNLKKECAKITGYREVVSKIQQ